MSKQVVVEIRRLVLAFFEGDEEKTEVWLKAPNPLLGGTAPETMIAMRREIRLLRFVQDQLTENEGPRIK